MYKQLLFMSDYPPSTVAGAPVIVRQLLRHYDMEKLDIFCCRTWHENQKPIVTQSFLPCPHTVFDSVKRFNLRPRRVFQPLQIALDTHRYYDILKKGRAAIKERGVEAIFTAPYGFEFSMAAYTLSKECGIPLYIFFSDDYWDGSVSYSLLQRATNYNQTEFVRAGSQVWLTSPAMVRSYKERFGVDGEFLFHFVDSDVYKTVRQEFFPPDDKIVLAYTGSINHMFRETMLWFCEWLNQGLHIDGKPVELVIYTPREPTEYLGAHVRWGGFVPMEEVPQKLAQAHLATILVSFTQQEMIAKMIRTSLYTKTIDYLATGTPTLVVSPAYAAEVDYFEKATAVVTTLDKQKVKAALERLLHDDNYRQQVQEAGFALVEERHSRAALQKIFLRHFQK